MKRLVFAVSLLALLGVALLPALAPLTPTTTAAAPAKLAAPTVTGAADSTIVPCLPAGPQYNPGNALYAEYTFDLTWTGTPITATLTGYQFHLDANHAISINGQQIGTSTPNPPFTTGRYCGNWDTEEAKLTLTFDPAILVKGTNTLRINSQGDDWGLSAVKVHIEGADVSGPQRKEVLVTSTYPFNYDGYTGEGGLTHIQVPTTYTDTVAAPLLIVVHDWQQNRDAPFREYAAEADKRGWLLASPETHGDRPYCVTACSNQDIRRIISHPGDHAVGRRAAQDVIDVFNYMVENYHVDRSRVYLIGRGLGATTTTLVAAKWPHLFAAAIQDNGPANVVSWDFDLTVSGKNPNPRNGNPVLANRVHTEMGGSHGQKFCEYERRSPLEFAVNLSEIPFLIVHGKGNDIEQYVPVEGGVQRNVTIVGSPDSYFVHHFHAEDLFLQILQMGSTTVERRWVTCDGNCHTARLPNYITVYFDWLAQHTRPQTPALAFRGRRETGGPLHWLDIAQSPMSLPNGQQIRNHWTNIVEAGYDPAKSIITTTVIEGENGHRSGNPNAERCPGNEATLTYNLADMGLPTHTTYVVERFAMDKAGSDAFRAEVVAATDILSLQVISGTHQLTLYPGNVLPNYSVVTLRNFENNYFGVTDTFICHWNVPGNDCDDLNYGTRSELWIQNALAGPTCAGPGPARTALIRFDQLNAHIPAGKTIRYASLSLLAGFRSTLPLENKDDVQILQVDVHRMTRNWVDSEATWNKATNSTPWGLPGAMGVPGDFANPRVDRRFVYQGDFAGKFDPTLKPWQSYDVKQTVEEWTRPNSPAPNYGFILRADRRLSYESSPCVDFVFFSAQNTPALQPKLVVVLADGDLDPQTPTPTPTATPSETPTPTVTPTPTETPTPTPTETPTETPTGTPTATVTPTATPAPQSYLPLVSK